MSTMTHGRALRGVLDDLPARGLPIPAPSRPQETVVAATVEALAKAHAKDRRKAERTIEEHGLTIEVARLRDRLDRAAAGDLQRLLLSVPGVPEKLFNDAIEKQLADEEDDDGVKDESVDAMVSALREILEVLRERGGASGASGSPKGAARASRSTAKKVTS